MGQTSTVSLPEPPTTKGKQMKAEQKNFFGKTGAAMNYFQGNKRSTYKESLLSPGVYQVELMMLRPGQRSFDGEVKKTLTLSFQTDTGAVINRTVTSSNHPTSALVTLVKGMTANNPPSSSVTSDGNQFTDFLNSLVGKKFRAQIEPSENGRFNNLVNIFPVEGV